MIYMPFLNFHHGNHIGCFLPKIIKYILFKINIIIKQLFIHLFFGDLFGVCKII